MNRTRTVTRPTSTTSSVIGVPIFSLAVRSASRTSTWDSLEFECGPIRGFETGSLARFDCNGSAMRKDRSHCLSDAELKVRIRLPPAVSLRTFGSGGEGYRSAMGLLSVIQALCSGWLESGDKPSMVVTCLPRMLDICTLHERVGSPSRCTVQAPHCATPHPNFVPVS